jgi:hypothetical protein
MSLIAVRKHVDHNYNKLHSNSMIKIINIGYQKNQTSLD